MCNKFIAYSSIFDDIVDVLAEWGSLYVLTRDGKIHVLQEKDTQTKLEARKPVLLLVCLMSARLYWLHRLKNWTVEVSELQGNK